jgi:hypothetical protein
MELFERNRVGTGKFTNPVLRIWMNCQKYEDSEFMFYQMGNWPKQSLLQQRSLDRGKERQNLCSGKIELKAIRRRKKRNVFTPNKEIKPSPWLYQPHSKSLFRPVGKNSLNLYL